MSNQMTVFTPGARPQHLARIQSSANIADLTAGVQASFPILRTKGKVWSITMNGATKPLTTPEGYPVPAMRLVLVKANPFASKTFYKSGYAEGDTAPPDCWSFDGQKPDASVQHPQCTSCAACPNNRLGSKISDSGSKVKACPDVKRIAVMEAKNGTLMLLRLPYTSMKSLADYAVWLSNQSPAVNYNEVLTELSFDMNTPYPKVNFKAVRWLNETETDLVQGALESTELAEILGGGAHEFSPQEAPAQPQAPLGPRPQPAAKPAPAPVQQEAEEFDPFAQAAAPEPEPAPAPRRKPAATKPTTTVVESGSLEDALAAALRT